MNTLTHIALLFLFWRYAFASETEAPNPDGVNVEVPGDCARLFATGEEQVDLVNGWYSLMGTHEGRPFYFNTERSVYIYWWKNMFWAISEEIDSETVISFNSEGHSTPESLSDGEWNFQEGDGWSAYPYRLYVYCQEDDWSTVQCDESQTGTSSDFLTDYGASYHRDFIYSFHAETDDTYTFSSCKSLIVSRIYVYDEYLSTILCECEDNNSCKMCGENAHFGCSLNAGDYLVMVEWDRFRSTTGTFQIDVGCGEVLSDGEGDGEGEGEDEPVISCGRWERVELGYEIIGNDIAVVSDIDNIHDCCGECFLNSECRFWTFYAPENACYLKDTMTETWIEPRAVSIYLGQGDTGPCQEHSDCDIGYFCDEERKGCDNCAFCFYSSTYPVGGICPDYCQDPEFVNDVAGADDISCGDRFEGHSENIDFYTFFEAQRVWVFDVLDEDVAVTVSSCGSDYDTKLEIFSGFYRLECQNDNKCHLQAEIECVLTPGRYYILLTGATDGAWFEDLPQAEGNYVVSVECAAVTEADKYPITCGQTVQGYSNTYELTTTTQSQAIFTDFDGGVEDVSISQIDDGTMVDVCEFSGEDLTCNLSPGSYYIEINEFYTFSVSCECVSDQDGDGVCDDVDQCVGNDMYEDGNGDGICDEPECNLTGLNTRYAYSTSACGDLTEYGTLAEAHTACCECDECRGITCKDSSLTSCSICSGKLELIDANYNYYLACANDHECRDGDYCTINGLCSDCHWPDCQTGEECWDNGISYTGTESHTASGVPCTNWNEVQTPASREVPAGSANYCRNPDDKQRPWCYKNGGPSWEFCSVDCESTSLIQLTKDGFYDDWSLFTDEPVIPASNYLGLALFEFENTTSDLDFYTHELQLCSTGTSLYDLNRDSIAFDVVPVYLSYFRFDMFEYGDVGALSDGATTSFPRICYLTMPFEGCGRCDITSAVRLWDWTDSKLTLTAFNYFDLYGSEGSATYKTTIFSKLIDSVSQNANN